MNKSIAFGFWLLGLGCLPVGAQRLLTLDSCRAMALRNNKQVSVSKVKQDVAANLRKSARTKYLPHVSALGSYMYTSERITKMDFILNFAKLFLTPEFVDGFIGRGFVCPVFSSITCAKMTVTLSCQPA